MRSTPSDDLDALEHDARAAGERWRSVEAAVARVRVERASSGGEVRVTVDGQGQLVDLGFGDRMRTTSPDHLAQLLLTALRRAQADLADEVAEAVATAGVAPDGDSARAVLDGYRRRFPPVDDEPPTPPTPPRAGGSTWLR